MSDRRRELLGQAMLVGVAGLVTGAVGGWMGVAAPAGVAEAAAASVRSFRWLLAAVPAAVVLLTVLNVRAGASRPYRPAGRALLTGAFVGGVGGALALALWFVPATNLPSALSGTIGAPELREAMVARLSGVEAALVPTVGLLAGLLACAWAARASGRAGD